MSPAKKQTKKPGIGSADVEDLRLRADIDHSTRLPVLFFFTSAAAWLVLSAVLGFVASMKLKSPEFFDLGAFTTYGRVYPALMNALIYGWGFQAAYGVVIWLMARLCRVPVRNPVTLVVAGHLWNLGVVTGVIAILCGKGTSMVWMAFPSFIWPLLLLSYVLIMIWAIVTFRARRDAEIYISQWYLLAAIFLFPWIFLTANLFVHVFPSAAVMSTAISAWYSSALLFFWFTPIGLATSYYLIPKILGRPIASYKLAKIGFWALMIIGGWTGMQRFMGGPLPAWMTTIGSEATILLLLPALAVGLNHYLTVRGKISYVHYSPTLRFTLFGTIGFVLTVFLAALMSFFGVGRILQFTLAVEGFDMLALYGFFSMTMFGAFYFIAPRVTRCEWLSGRLIRFHFWLSAYGICTLVVGMIIGGAAQGGAQADWDTAFKTSVIFLNSYVVAQCIGWGLILISNLIFLFHVLLMAVRLGRRTSTGPTLIHDLPEEGDLNASTAKA